MSPEIKAKKEALPYNAQQRVQAVLSLWSERRRTREVCRELGIHPSALYSWERRALQAMFQALEGTSAGVAAAAATVLIICTILPVALVYRLLRRHELSML